MSRDLPSPKTVDTWFERIKSDTEWLYDAKLGRSGAYAYAYNAVDGLQSPRTQSVGSTGHADPTGRQIATQNEETSEGAAGTFKALSRAVQAANHIRVAQERLAKARSILEERDMGPTEGSNIVFLRKGELDNLYRRQREREMSGGGFGAT